MISSAKACKSWPFFLISFLLVLSGCDGISSSNFSSLSTSYQVIDNMKDDYGSKYEQLPAMKVNPLGVGISSLAMTFNVKDRVPYQNEIVYPSFTPQDNPLIDLSGEWYKMRISDSSTSLSYTFEGRSQNLIQRFKGESKGYLRGEFAKEESATITLPAPENHLTHLVTATSAEKFEDGTWYYKEFEVSEFIEDRFFLKSLGSNYVTDLFINGQYVGYHEGGHTPFAFDITDYIEQGTNAIAMRVHGIPFGSRSDTIPGDIEGTDYFNYTGPMQKMYIEIKKPVHIARVDIKTWDTLDGFDAKVVLENFTNISESEQVQYMLYEANPERYLDDPSAKSIIGQHVLGGFESVSVPANGVAVKNLSIAVAAAKLWDVLTPNLYVLEIVIGEEHYYAQFGFRTIKAVGTHLYLNDVDTFFAGVARHEESLQYGRTFDWNTTIADFIGIRELGATFVRTGHYPNQIYTYILLDRFGLASGVEVPIWQNDDDSYKKLLTRGIALQIFREMVFSNYNSASIIFWSTQNEASAIIHRPTMNETLVNDLKNNYDDGRIVMQSAAADRPSSEDKGTIPLDAAGYTLYFETFHGDVAYGGTRKFLTNTRTYAGSKDKPAIATEYGYWRDDDRIFRTLQATLEVATVNKDGTTNPDGYMACVVYWTYSDWLVNHQKTIQGMGLTNLARVKKPLFYKVQSVYQDLMQNRGKADGLKIPEVDKKINVIVENGKQYFTLTGQDLTDYNYIQFAFSEAMFSRNFSIVLEAETAFTYQIDTIFEEVRVPTSFFMKYIEKTGENRFRIEMDSDIILKFRESRLTDLS